jgi:ABC-type branched-subunit amino acid transport system ATPase component
MLLLDESLVAPSDEYVVTIGRFLRKLSATTGIPILFITQNRSFVEHSDHAYQGSEDVAQDGSWSLGIRRVQK